MKPLYMQLSSTERKEKARHLAEMYRQCLFCPRACRVDRAAGRRGECGAPAWAVVDSYGPHFGEERVLVGSGGSGTIFFAHCNLACVFCQNWSISRTPRTTEQTAPEELASMMLDLQRQGCHNINLVTPTPHLPAIAAAIDLAAEQGLALPVVYNSGGYDAVVALQEMEGLVDIYMPDAKYGDDQTGEELSGVKNYFRHMRAALKEMQRQVGDLAVDECNIAYRGLLVRHLVLPGGLAGTAAVVRFLKEEISPRCAVNIMGQYRPAYLASRYPLLDRRPTAAEYRAAREEAIRAGLRLVD